jgi:hypothetical protein
VLECINISAAKVRPIVLNPPAAEQMADDVDAALTNDPRHGLIAEAER